MSNERQPGRITPPKRRGRRFLAWPGGIMAVMLGLSLLGARYESAAEVADASAYPPTGEMFDVGGHRLHINCAGMGSPVVVIEAGWGDWSAAWSSWVQTDVASTTRVCSYDRAGMGHSEAGPLPRTAERFAQELHTLLQEADIPGPYVLVGHSAGGLTVRVFARDYAEQVAGVVLIDSMSPGPASAGATAPSPTDSRFSGQCFLTLPARIGLVRLVAGPLGLKPELSPEVANAYTAFAVTPRYTQTWMDEGTGMAESLAQAGAVQTFGDLPLIVLSRGRVEGQDLEWQQQQTELLQLSSNSEQHFADRSGHNIEFDQPEAAVAAIVQMVEQVRRQASQ